MKLVIDMNLSPRWVEALRRHGYSAVHWSTVGDGRAPDSEILGWARDNGHVVFTNDLDFGAILAATRAGTPSVIQIRTQDLVPSACEALLVSALRQHADVLEQGALVTVDEKRSRSRVLPLR